MHEFTIENARNADRQQAIPRITEEIDESDEATPTMLTLVPTIADDED